MKTISFHSREFPTISRLIRFIILIAILCFLTSIVSTAQVPTKSCCKAYQHINFEEIKEFLNYLDSIGGIEKCDRKGEKCKKPEKSIEPECIPVWPFWKNEKPGRSYYFDGLYLTIANKNRKVSIG